MNKIDQPEIALALVPEGIKVKLTKVSEAPDPMHPNNIPTGDTRVGYVRPSLVTPYVGMRYGLESVIEKNGKSLSPNHWFLTSEVIEIIENNTFNKTIQFRTLNSIYKIEIL